MLRDLMRSAVRDHISSYIVGSNSKLLQQFVPESYMNQRLQQQIEKIPYIRKAVECNASS